MSVTQPPVNSAHIRRLDPVLEPGHTYASVTDKIAAVVLTRPLGIGWLAGFTLTFSLTMVLFGSIAWLVTKGTGIWSINIPMG
jgi:molybdopterin-containing oxidoreductase family membrane subunit